MGRQTTSSSMRLTPRSRLALSRPRRATSRSTRPLPRPGKETIAKASDQVNPLAAKKSRGFLHPGSFPVFQPQVSEKKTSPLGNWVNRGNRTLASFVAWYHGRKRGVRKRGSAYEAQSFSCDGGADNGIADGHCGWACLGPEPSR